MKQFRERPTLIAAARAVGVVVAVLMALASVDSSAGSQPQKVDAPGIENFSEIRGNTGFGGPLVGFGGATSPEAMRWLKRQGFVTVVNLRLATETNADVGANRSAADATGLKYVNLPFDPTAADAAATVDAFLAAVSATANQPVYVHCSSATRAAALWMIGRVVDDHWTIDAAEKEAESIAGKPAQAVAIATHYLEAQRAGASTKP